MREIEEIQANIEKFVANKNGGEHDDVWDSLIEGCRYEILYNLTDKLDVDRLIEICEAEREGKLVVLPCKIGDVVYFIKANVIKACTIFFIGIERNGTIKFQASDNSSLDIYFDLYDYSSGETWFSTREEAEKALAERNE